MKFYFHSKGLTGENKFSYLCYLVYSVRIVFDIRVDLKEKNYFKEYLVNKSQNGMSMVAKFSSFQTKNYFQCTKIIIIDNSQINSKCRMCGKVDETINHILSECSKLAQKEYKRRHDWVGKKIHWEYVKYVTSR